MITTLNAVDIIKLMFNAKTTPKDEEITFANLVAAITTEQAAQSTDKYTITNTTTDVTQTELFLDPAAQTRLALANNSAWAFDIRLLGRRSTGADVYHARLEGTIKRGANAAATALVNDPQLTVIAGSSLSWDATAEADTTNGALVIKVTGENAKTISWKAVVQLVKVS